MSHDTYCCALCGGEFESGWSDEDAQQEAEQLWGQRADVPGADMAVVCDDCFQQITARPPVQDAEGRG